MCTVMIFNDMWQSNHSIHKIRCESASEAIHIDREREIFGTSNRESFGGQLYPLFMLSPIRSDRNEGSINTQDSFSNTISHGNRKDAYKLSRRQSYQASCDRHPKDL